MYRVIIILTFISKDYKYYLVIYGYMVAQRTVYFIKNNCKKGYHNVQCGECPDSTSYKY